MNTYLMDECFRARMQRKKELFPISEFKKMLVEDFSKHGIVFIQNIILNPDYAEKIVLDPTCGIRFNSQKNLNIALRLLRRWGFSITEIKANENHCGCYIVQLSKEYLRNKIGKDQLGTIYTGIRSYQARDVKKNH